jgi:hypothetical protein
MKINTYIFYILLLFLTTGINKLHSQVYHEFGVMAGSVSFGGDFGVLRDVEASKQNVGFGFGINHYMNFAYADFISDFTLQHFKVRSTLLYHTTGLNLNNSVQSNLIFGEGDVLEIGSGIEYYFMRLRDFDRGSVHGAITPYLGIGLNFVYASPVPSPIPSLSKDNFITMSTNMQVGLKYRSSLESELFIELRRHDYFSDFVDGLSRPNSKLNRSNQWMLWVTLGYSYYID